MWGTESRGYLNPKPDVTPVFKIRHVSNLRQKPARVGTELKIDTYKRRQKHNTGNTMQVVDFRVNKQASESRICVCVREKSTQRWIDIIKDKDPTLTYDVLLAPILAHGNILWKQMPLFCLEYAEGKRGRYSPGIVIAHTRNEAVDHYCILTPEGQIILPKDNTRVRKNKPCARMQVIEYNTSAYTINKLL